MICKWGQSYVRVHMIAIKSCQFQPFFVSFTFCNILKSSHVLSGLQTVYTVHWTLLLPLSKKILVFMTKRWRGHLELRKMNTRRQSLTWSTDGLWLIRSFCFCFNIHYGHRLLEKSIPSVSLCVLTAWDNLDLCDLVCVSGRVRKVCCLVNLVAELQRKYSSRTNVNRVMVQTHPQNYCLSQFAWCNCPAKPIRC